MFREKRTTLALTLCTVCLSSVPSRRPTKGTVASALLEHTRGRARDGADGFDIDAAEKALALGRRILSLRLGGSTDSRALVCMRHEEVLGRASAQLVVNVEADCV